MTLEQLIETCTALVGLDPGHRRVIEEAIAVYAESQAQRVERQP